MTFQQKVKNSFIKPEEALEGETYSLTINPSDDYQCLKANALNRFRVFKANMEIMLSKIYNYTRKCVMYIEISSQGRLHMHGTFQIKDILAFYLIVPHYLSTWCASEMDTIADGEKWEIYCTKSKDYIGDIDNVLNQDKDEYEEEPLILRDMKVKRTICVNAERA